MDATMTKRYHEDTDGSPFDAVLQELLQNQKDDRSRRLAAVAAAMMDVSSSKEPLKVYANCIAALQAAEADPETMVALLDLLGLVIPFVSVATLKATLNLSSRVLRGIVVTGTSVDGINATLRAVCRTTRVLLQKMDGNNDDSTDKQVQQLFKGTLLHLLNDKRPKVRKEAQHEILLLLPTHTGAQRILQLYAESVLSHYNSSNQQQLLHLLGFLQQAVAYLDTPKLGHAMTKLLMQQMDTTKDSTSTFVAISRDAKEKKIMVVNGLLSVLIVMVTNEEDASEKTIEFASRVLASLLQQDVLLKRFVLMASDDIGESFMETFKTLYGRLLIQSCSKLLLSNSDAVAIGYKLFPLVLAQVLYLSLDDSVARVLMAELTLVLRSMQFNTTEEGRVCLEKATKEMHAVLLLKPEYRETWHVTLAPLGILMQLAYTTDGSSTLTRGVFKSLVEAHDSKADTHKTAVQETLQSFIQSVGMETVWSWIDWNLPNKKGIATNRAWLLPLLKTTLQKERLGFFQTQVLSMARECDLLSHEAKSQREYYKGRVVDLWLLLNCACQHPPDVQEVFPTLSQTLVKAMGDHVRYPQLVAIICGGLKVLASGISERLQDNKDSQGAQGDAQVMEQVSVKVLPALFKLVETLKGTNTKTNTKVDEKEVDAKTKTDTESVTEAIAALARLAPPAFLQKLFSKIMQRLLVATQSGEAEKICTLLGLAQALVVSESLPEDSISLLYRSLKPLCRSDEFEARVQKRAYKVMAEICQRYQAFVLEPERLEEMTELLTGSIVTCQVSARHMRLKCMACIVNGLDSSNEQHMAVIPNVVGEVLLCLKDSNGKTREAAYQLLLSMATVRDDDDMTEYFRVVVAALGAQTPHMRSAAVMALSRLVFEFARENMTVQAMLPSLLQTVVVLFDENSREVIKSVVGFARVSVAAMTPEQLEPLLPELLGGMLKYHRGKDRFRSKIKIILKKLVRTYGYETLMPLVPEGDTRLLTHMRKLDERAKRRKAAEKEDGGVNNNAFDEMMESDEDDSDDGRTFMTGMTGFTRMTARNGKSIRSAAIEKSDRKSVAASTRASSRSQRLDASRAPRLRAEANGEVLDMLDPKTSRSVQFADDMMDDSDDDDGGVMEFDEAGRLVVPDDLDIDAVDGEEGTALEDDTENDEIKLGTKKRRLNKYEGAKVARAEAQKKKHTKNQPKALGASYKAKKAGGDVKRKEQKYEPYAYVPLDGKSYTKKHRRAAVEQMSSVVRHGKRKRR